MISFYRFKQLLNNLWKTGWSLTESLLSKRSKSLFPCQTNKRNAETLHTESNKPVPTVISAQLLRLTAWWKLGLVRWLHCGRICINELCYGGRGLELFTSTRAKVRQKNRTAFDPECRRFCEKRTSCKPFGMFTGKQWFHTSLLSVLEHWYLEAISQPVEPGDVEDWWYYEFQNSPAEARRLITSDDVTVRL